MEGPPGNAVSKEAVGVQESKHVQEHGNSRGSETCEKSMTFVMESVDAGLGKTLLGLWMAYGLAQEEGRAFFIDDSNWAYGKYTTFFSSPPIPECKLPPATQRLPCPHQTRHLVISPSTYQWAFGDLVEPLHDNHHKHQQAVRQRRAFTLARVGHDALFHLTGVDAGYLSSRLASLDLSAHSHSGMTVGLHIRRGDRHPWESQYSDSYIPPSLYSNAAQSLISQFVNPENLTLSEESESRLSASKILLASDDPDIYSTAEFRNSAERAQSQILLASKATLDAALPDAGHPRPVLDDPPFIKFVEPNVGWEGGFFASIFWGLGNAAEGRAAARGLREERPKEQPNADTLRLREYVGRAYLLDLKVVGNADRVVCGVSSFGCRLLGVMKGWQGAIEDGEWNNVDGGYSGWVGLVEDD
ncbi:MAG: hypothetical protein Q9220_002377 [cf. Caloplaca sp. 1 TL-2023]